MEDVFGKPKPSTADTVHQPIQINKWTKWFQPNFNFSMLTLHCQCAVTFNHMQLDKLMQTYLTQTYMYVRTNQSTWCFCYNVRLREIKDSVGAAVASIYFMIQLLVLFYSSSSWLSTFSWYNLNYLHVTFVQRQPKNHIEMFYWPHFYEEKKHDTVCIAIFLLAQQFILKKCIYWIVLPFHVF